MAVHQGNELVWTLIENLILAGEKIYKDIPLDKLKEYLMYNIRPFKTVSMDSDSPYPMIKLIGDNHEFNYIIWDNDSNEIMYTTEKQHNISDVLRLYRNLVSIKITPKGVLRSDTFPLKTTEEISFSKEYIGGSVVILEEYLPVKQELKVTIYSPDNYSDSLDDFEDKHGKKITSYHGFISLPTERYGEPCYTISIALKNQDGKECYQINTLTADGDSVEQIMPYKEGTTVYQLYYNYMAEMKCFSHWDSAIIKKDKK